MWMSVRKGLLLFFLLGRELGPSSGSQNGAYALFNVTRSGIIDLKDRDRLSNSSLPITSCGPLNVEIDGPQKERSQKSEAGEVSNFWMATHVQTGEVRLTGSIVGSHTSKESLSYDHGIRRDCACWDYGEISHCNHPLGVRPSCEYCREVSLTSFRKHRPVTSVILPYERHYTAELRKYCLPEGLRSSFDAAGLQASGSCNWDTIITKIPRILKSGNSKEAVAGAPHDFATVFVSVVADNSHSVSGDDNSSRRPLSKNQGSQTSFVEKASSQQQPKYMRRNNTSHMGFVRTEDHVLVDDITDADIDVSYNGQRWFHLLGRLCLRSCPALRITNLTPLPRPR